MLKPTVELGLRRIATSSRTQCLYAPARERIAALRTNGPRTSTRSLSTAARKKPSSITSRLEISQHRSQYRNGTWSRGIKTIQQAEAKNSLGPFSMISAVIFVASGFGLFFYFRYEKERMERQRVAEATKGVGKPKVGGPFELTDQDGRPWSSDEMKGKYSLVYFGFSHCPDICPEELDKMAIMIDTVATALPPSNPKTPELLPVFITCDPARDNPAVLKSYLKEFHTGIIGLTGAWEQIKAVCKLYRVYFSTPSGVRPGQDYLVDHSIYFYLMDPDGDFVEAIGRQHTAEEGAKLITDHMADWKGEIRKS